MSEHEHLWIIAAIRVLMEPVAGNERRPGDMRADVCCQTCSAATTDLSMTQLRDLITEDHVRGDSVAQWASIGVLFQ